MSATVLTMTVSAAGADVDDATLDDAGDEQIGDDDIDIIQRRVKKIYNYFV